MGNGADTKASKGSGFLGKIEYWGNKMPHPLLLFTYLLGLVFVLSFVMSKLGITTVHPSTGETIEVINMLSIAGLIDFMKNFVSNFQGFAVLGICLTIGVVTGLCDNTGLFTSAIRMSLGNVKGNIVVFVIAIIACLANQTSEAAFVLVPAIAGAIFYGMGRHPLAGVFLGYASACSGFSTSILPGSAEVFLTPLINESAHMMDPNYNMSILGSYFFLFVSAFVVAGVCTFVTVKIVEPRLGAYHPSETLAGGEGGSVELTAIQKSATKKAGISVLIYLLIVIAVCIPKTSFLRGETGSLIDGAPLMDCLVFLLLLLFFIPGVVYGKATGQIKKAADAANFLYDGVKPFAPFIVNAMIIAQFLKIFDKSNIGKVIAINGGQWLKTLPLPSWMIAIAFLLLIALINLMIASVTTKYLIFGPIFIPMMMQIGMNPAFTIAVYRLGDCVTNNLTPMMPAFIILLGTCQKYEKKCGMGTIFSNMLPYTIGLFLVFVVQIVLWIVLNLPVGVGTGVWL